MKNQPFQVVMSKGDPIQIDIDEVQKVLQGISSGSMVVVRSGIINPSYCVSIIKDVKRAESFFIDTKHDKSKRINGVKRLENIFEDTDIKKLTG